MPHLWLVPFFPINGPQPTPRVIQRQLHHVSKQKNKGQTKEEKKRRQWGASSSRLVGDLEDKIQSKGRGEKCPKSSHGTPSKAWQMWLSSFPVERASTCSDLWSEYLNRTLHRETEQQCLFSRKVPVTDEETSTLVCYGFSTYACPTKTCMILGLTSLG